MTGVADEGRERAMGLFDRLRGGGRAAGGPTAGAAEPSTAARSGAT